MNRICKMFALLFVFLITDAEAKLNFIGSLDLKKENYYYTGGDVLSWSLYKAKAYQKKSNIIFSYNFERKEEKVVYTGTRMLSRIQLSPDNKYIAAYSPKEKAVLIFDRDWQNVVEIKGRIYEYVWHPDSNKIVYVTGEKVKGKRAYSLDVKSDGLWLYDIEEEKKKKILESGTHIRINLEERNLYLWNGTKTVSYNFDSGKFSDTSMTVEDGEYSPDQRYYFYYLSMTFDPPYWSPFRIYDVKLNKPLPAELIGFISERNPTDYIWGRNGKLAFSGRTTRTDVEKRLYIYNLKAKKVIRKFEGQIAGYSDDLSWLVIYRDGKFYLESF